MVSKACEKLYDLHNHLLFGVDDGAKDLDACEAMLRDAAENNIGLIAATSHILPRTDMVKYEANFPKVVELAAEYGIKVVRGGEYNARCFPENPPYVTLGGSENGTVLLDFRLPTFPPEFQQLVDNVFNCGNTLMIAHPERTFPESMLSELERLAECGVVYQVTAGSLLGKFGAPAKSFGWKLLRNNLAKIIASDAHDVDNRPSFLSDAFEAVAHKLGGDAAIALQENARRIIEEPGSQLEKIPVKRSIFSLFNWLGK